MHAHNTRIALAALLLTLALAGAVVAQSLGPAVDWWAIVGGGGPAAGGNVTLDGALGQPIAGPSTGGDVALDAGYWQEDRRAASTTSLTSTPNPSRYGQTIALTATVGGASGTPAGAVAFYADGTPIAGCGAASLDGSGRANCRCTLPTGTHSLTAAYYGSSTYLPSDNSAAPRSHTVQQATTTVTLSSSLNPAAPGDTVALMAAVEAVAPGGGTPAGNVTFCDGAAELGTEALIAGRATLTTSTLAAGSHKITAVYAGSADHAASTSDALVQTIDEGQNPKPVLASLSPDRATAGGPGFFLTVTGSGFVPASVVQWGGAARPTAYVSATALTAQIDAGDLAPAGTALVTVTSPAPGGGTSSALPFTVELGALAITALDPAEATAGGDAFTLKVRGTGFVDTATVQWAGAERTTTYLSTGELEAEIEPADIATPGTALVTVAQGGSTSNAYVFAIRAVTPTLAISALAPAHKTAGDAGFDLTVTGTGFAAGTTVYWGGAARATTVVSPTELTADIAAADIATAGTVLVRAVSASEASNALPFAVENPAPAITALSPSTATAGDGALVLAVLGTGFAPTSQVRWAGAVRTTSYVSPGELTAYLPAADLATASAFDVTVANPAPGGGTSGPATFTVENPLPAITGLVPSGAVAGRGDLALTVYGSGFVPTSQVRWDGAPRTTTYVSATELSAAIPAADLASAGTFEVTVTNPTPGGGTSNAETFALVNPLPALTRLEPAHAAVGGGSFTLAVHGSGFVAGSVVRWNGADRTTTYVSAGELRAAIPAGDIARVGPAQVTVTNPTPGGGASNGLSFGVRPRPTPTPVPATIRLRVTLAPGAAVGWGELWTAVQWLDGTGAWHDVEGWQGGLEGSGKAWSVGQSELGKGPFRWALTRGQGGALVAVSESFHLPGAPGQTVERSVTVQPPVPTPTAAATRPPAGEPPAGPAGPAAATATPTTTPSATPTSTTAPTAAGAPPQPTAGGLQPVVQPEPQPGPRERAWPCASPLVAGLALLALFLLGIAGGWLWQRRRQARGN